MIPEAILTRIEALSAHDGPGLRTTLFFKGCSLRCRWCHNPETIRPYPELQWLRRVCIGCQRCAEACETGAIDFARPSAGLSSQPSAEPSRSADFLIACTRCTRCFSCVRRCPSGALSRVGKTYTPQEVAEEIFREAELIRQLNGGVTFSGGEPALYADFIRELAEILKTRDLHLALDTCGQAPFAAYERLVPRMDLVLFDVKEMDPEKHRDFTGADNRRILRNLYATSRLIRTKGCRTRLWIRTPLIPGMTATRRNVTTTGTFLATHFADLIDRWELCAFNKMCREKYERFGVDWPLAATPLLGEGELKALLEEAKRAAPGLYVKASGLTEKSNVYEN
jgi:pyruvate formate lyase activating enzyme